MSKKNKPKAPNFSKKIVRVIKTTCSIHVPFWLVAIFVIVLVLRIPSFFEPYSYGDETTYLTLGESIRQGHILYKDIFDHKPPLLYFVAAVAGNLFWFKTILAFWSIATIVLFWKLTEALFPLQAKDPQGRRPKNLRLHQTATLIFALLTTLPLLEGNIANAENFMIGLTIAAYYVLLTKKLNSKTLIFGGILLSLAALFKVPALFDAPVIVFYWLITEGVENIREVVRKTILLVLGFAIPIGATFIWYALRGAFADFLTWGILINFVYINAYKPAANQLPFLQKNAPLVFRSVLTLLGTLALFVARKRVSKQYVLVAIWLFFTLLAITLPERPYPHYLLQATAPLALLLGMLLTLNTIEQSLVIIPLTIFFFVPIYYKFWYYPTNAYYQRFLDFAANKVSKEEYLGKFGGHIPRAYKIAETVMNTTDRNDNILVWGPESQTVYALSRRVPPIRFVANFHIFDYSTLEVTAKEIAMNLPKEIVILPDSEDFPELKTILNTQYLLLDEVDGALIYLLGPSIPKAGF